MKLIEPIVGASAELRALRRDLHAHPELRYEEFRTSDRVADALTRWGIEVHRGLGGTGVVGVLKAGTSTRMVGLRADMDALPVTEVNTFAHRSQHAGRMHACGHDGHTAMLLGAAQYLAQHRHFDGTVVLIFQPAEEGGGGARRMIDDGLFERWPCDAVFAMHNWPGIGAGCFGVNGGPIMASSNEFEIVVRGKGAHAALPHLGIDPVFVAVQIVNGLQGIITRSKKPIDAAVLSVTQISAGEAVNVIPDTAIVRGTVRTYSDEVTALIERRLRAIAEVTAHAHEAHADVDFVWNYPPTVNHPAEAAFVADVLQDIVGAAAVDRTVEAAMTAEDFAFMLRARPGAYFFIGNGDGDHRSAGHGMGPCTLHNASYDFNDELLPLGATVWVRMAERFLSD